MKFDQEVPYVLFYPSIKFHDDPSFVRRMVAILVFDFWWRVGGFGQFFAN